MSAMHRLDMFCAVPPFGFHAPRFDKIPVRRTIISNDTPYIHKKLRAAIGTWCETCAILKNTIPVSPTYHYARLASRDA